MKLEIKDASHAAWRARYVYLDGRKIAHLGFDPDSSNPQVFGSVNGHEFRFRVPTIRWTYPMAPWKLKLYMIQNQFLHNMDGRYGWGSPYARKAKNESR